MNEAPATPTFYVDPITTYALEAIRDPQARRTSSRWCHLWTDGTPDDLHRFAAKLGLRRVWFQDRAGFPHYDLVPRRREAALRHGAQEMHLSEWLKRQYAQNPEWRPASGGFVPHSPQDDLPPPVVAAMPAPLIPMREMRPNIKRKIFFSLPAGSGRTTMRVAQATLDLFSDARQPLASRLQPLLLFASRFVERHARRGESLAEGLLALEGREQHLAEDLRQRLESAVLEVMTTTLARCCPANRYVACAAFYRPGIKEGSQWGIAVTLWDSRTRNAPRR